jgi:hypothetical protein
MRANTQLKIVSPTAEKRTVERNPSAAQRSIQHTVPRAMASISLWSRSCEPRPYPPGRGRWVGRY